MVCVSSDVAPAVHHEPSIVKRSPYEFIYGRYDTALADYYKVGREGHRDTASQRDKRPIGRQAGRPSRGCRAEGGAVVLWWVQAAEGQSHPFSTAIRLKVLASMVKSHTMQGAANPPTTGPPPPAAPDIMPASAAARIRTCQLSCPPD